jgi:hypothetical protein
MSEDEIIFEVGAMALDMTAKLEEYRHRAKYFDGGIRTELLLARISGSSKTLSAPETLLTDIDDLTAIHEQITTIAHNLVALIETIPEQARVLGHMIRVINALLRDANSSKQHFISVIGLATDHFAAYAKQLKPE